MYSHILVPLDGSAWSEYALPHAIEFARVRNARLLLLHVIESPQMEAVVAGPAVAASVPASMILKETQEKEQLQANAYLKRLKAKLESKEGIRCVVLVDKGNPAQCIANAADHFGVDLVIMTSHRRTALTSLFHRELALDVLRRIKHPVLLVCPTEQQIAKDGHCV